MVFGTLVELKNHIAKHHVSFANDKRDMIMETLVRTKDFLNSESSAESVNIPAIFYHIEDNGDVTLLHTEIVIGKYDKRYENGGYTYSERVICPFGIKG